MHNTRCSFLFLLLSWCCCSLQAAGSAEGSIGIPTRRDASRETKSLKPEEHEEFDGSLTTQFTEEYYGDYVDIVPRVNRTSPILTPIADPNLHPISQPNTHHFSPSSTPPSTPPSTLPSTPPSTPTFTFPSTPTSRPPFSPLFSPYFPACNCSWDEECSNDVLGSTYIYKDVITTSTVTNITSAIEYADAQLCQEENGYRRVALETSSELYFLVECLLCNRRTDFGTSSMKTNIMTAGTVEVTRGDLLPHEVLETMHGEWSAWDEEVNGTVPFNVFLLDPVSGSLGDQSDPVPQGAYLILLIGNGKQLCDEGIYQSYLSWGLMSHEAIGPLGNLVSYVICEKDTNPNDTTSTTTSVTTISTTSSTPTTPTTTTTTSTSTTPTTTVTSTSTTTSTTPTTTTSTTTSTTTTPIDGADCCKLENEDQLCPGQEKEDDCPPGYSGRRKVECIAGRLEVVEDHCIAEWIIIVEFMISSGDSVVEISGFLKNETDNASHITLPDLTCLVSIITNMSSLLEMQIASSDLSNAQLKQDLVRNYTADLVKIEGNLFTFEDVWDGSDKENLGRLGSSLLHELERTGFILADHSEEDLLHFTDPVLYMSVLSKPRSELAGLELYFPSESLDSFIRLPDDFEDYLPPGETQGRVVVFFLDQLAGSRALPSALNSLTSEDKPTEINSFVVSMTLGALNHSVSFSPKGGQVLLRLQHAVKESGPYFRKLYRWRRDGEAPSMIPRSAVCVYWNSTSSAWVPDGCQLITTNHDVTYCSCSHLSMISIITDVHSYVGRDATLDVLGTLLSSLSCVALVLAFLILQFCKGVQASPRIAITKQLCISLFLSHFFLILFLDRDFLKLSAEACKVVAGLLHYLLTASIGWMLAEGLQLFHTVHFTLDPTNFIVTYWLVGYGLPVVVVLVTALVAFGSDQWKTQEAYAPPGSEYCWLTTEDGYIWAFTGPLAVVIVVNAVIMVLAIRSAAILKTNRRKSLHHRILLCIKGSFSLNCILGVTWVFGLLYINTEHVFAYLFTIFNASQGVMIFVFNCMLNENVRTALVTSLPRAIKQRLMSKASQNGLSSGRGSSGACTTYNRPVNHHHHHSHHHHHHHRQPAPVSPADQETTLHNDSRLTALEYPRHPARCARSYSDVTELQRSRQRFPAEEPSTSFSRPGHDQGQEEKEEWRRPSLPGHWIDEAFHLPHASLSHGSPTLHPAGLSHEASRISSVAASRVSPPDRRNWRRKASQWSADTQISFISDGGNSRKNSLESFSVGSHSPASPSSSTSSSSSVHRLLALPTPLEETLRTSPAHRKSDPRPVPLEVQRCIHTIPECEERSPSSANTFSFL